MGYQVVDQKMRLKSLFFFFVWEIGLWKLFVLQFAKGLLRCEGHFMTPRKKKPAFNYPIKGFWLGRPLVGQKKRLIRPKTQK